MEDQHREKEQQRPTLIVARIIALDIDDAGQMERGRQRAQVDQCAPDALHVQIGVTLDAAVECKKVVTVGHAVHQHTKDMLVKHVVLERRPPMARRARKVRHGGLVAVPLIQNQTEHIG
eukprot:2225279-Prymnesium_polylepis.1